MSGRRRIPREIIIKHAGEYSEAEARAKIIKMIAEHKRGALYRMDAAGKSIGSM